MLSDRLKWEAYQAPAPWERVYIPKLEPGAVMPHAGYLCRGRQVTGTATTSSIRVERRYVPAEATVVISKIAFKVPMRGERFHGSITSKKGEQ